MASQENCLRHQKKKQAAFLNNHHSHSLLYVTYNTSRLFFLALLKNFLFGLLKRLCLLYKVMTHFLFKKKKKNRKTSLSRKLGFKKHTHFFHIFYIKRPQGWWPPGPAKQLDVLPVKHVHNTSQLQHN